MSCCNITAFLNQNSGSSEMEEIFISFLLHTGNLILRWYVAQHAPWSNGYEMITFAAWSLLLIGLIFYKKSDFVVALATLFTGTLLFVSYLDKSRRVFKVLLRINSEKVRKCIKLIFQFTSIFPK